MSRHPYELLTSIVHRLIAWGTTTPKPSALARAIDEARQDATRLRLTTARPASRRATHG